MIECGILGDPVKKTGLPKNFRDSELASMDRAGFGSAEFELKFSRLEGVVHRHLISLIQNITPMQNHLEGERSLGSLMIREMLSQGNCLPAPNPRKIVL